MVKSHDKKLKLFSKQVYIYRFHESLLNSYYLFFQFVEEGDSEGLFLVRESPTVEGAFILSVVNEGQPRHYQINRHGTDAFFSIGKCSMMKAIF
jgi:hypothetical protein